MDINTIISDYLIYTSDQNSYYFFDSVGKSFIVKNQSGYYCPCYSAFYTVEPSSTLNFVKGTEYNEENQVGYIKTYPSTEDPDFDFSSIYNYFDTTVPFVPWIPSSDPL